MRAYVIWLMNYLAFYALWVLCIVAARFDMPYIAIPIVVLYLILHLVFISQAWKKEALLIIVLTAVGAVNESVLSLLGAVTYVGALWGGVSWWGLALWASFATTYWHAFSWLSSRPILSAVLGAIVAPICYAWLGLMHVIEYPHGSARAMLTIRVVWSLMLPCTFLISKLIARNRKRTS
jgi:hypothetical protein